MLIKHIITESEVVQEITRPRSQPDAVDYLIDRGYKYLGSGYYATVVGKPETPHVVKIFDHTDKGYLEFIALSLATKNPHFPQFRGKPMRVSKEYYAIRMEKLSIFAGNSSEIYGFEYGYQLSNMLSRIMHNAKKGNSKNQMLTDADIEELSNNYEEIPFATVPIEIRGMKQEEIVEYKFEELCNNHPDLVEAAWLIGRHVHPSRNIDLHLGNMMMRGDTLVITDPVSFGNYK